MKKKIDLEKVYKDALASIQKTYQRILDYFKSASLYAKIAWIAIGTGVVFLIIGLILL